MGECVGCCLDGFLQWIAPIIASFFPWPALILFLLLFGPVREGLASFAASIGNLPRAVTAINVAGLKINLDPAKAKEVLAISREVVIEDFDRAIGREVEKLKLWPEFKNVIEKGLIPLFDPALVTNDPDLYRVTVHVPDTLQIEMLYQLVDYYPPNTFPPARGSRKSIRFGAIGKAWRLGRSAYSGAVSTSPEDLIKDWGMTRDEAKKAGRGRQTFLAIIITDESDVPLAIFYMDAKPTNFLKGLSADEISKKILDLCTSEGLTRSLIKIRTKMQDQASNPKIK